jgi:hypothetical protein
MGVDEIFKDVEGLTNAWCDRRCLNALRFILQGWPLSSGLTDDWAQLLDALKSVRASAKHELTPQELEVVGQLIPSIEKIVYRR